MICPVNTKRIRVIRGFSPHRAVNTVHLGHKNQIAFYKAKVAVCSDNT